MLKSDKVIRIDEELKSEDRRFNKYSQSAKRTFIQIDVEKSGLKPKDVEKSGFFPDRCGKNPRSDNPDDSKYGLRLSYMSKTVATNAMSVDVIE
jgi:hypothetical protein